MFYVGWMEAEIICGGEIVLPFLWKLTTGDCTIEM